MPTPESMEPNPQPEDPNPDEATQLDTKRKEDDDSDSDSDSESDSDSDSDSEPSSDADKEKDDEPPLTYVRARDQIPDDDSPEANIKLFDRVLNSRRLRRQREEEEAEYKFDEDRFDFPKDPEDWKEEDLRELWGDAPEGMTKPGWDPMWADEEDWEIVRREVEAGRDPPIAPFYVPFRKKYPVIPDNHHDIATPKAVIQELDRIEMFLKWVSYIFPDGSSYEGTAWDDLAHGKGVYVAEMGLVRYEGEWLQNEFEGHGVIEVDIPDIEPIPGSKLEEQMRAEGHIISRDYMSKEDREWLEMDIEDSLELAGDRSEVPFYETNAWKKEFGMEPEKGRYRYAGQWKHGRMHGCGQYELNERTIYGRFYFGELLHEPYGCEDEIAAMHAGIAEVAAAKARMFINKPDGMVREEKGPYSDPQHPYFYEEDDVWMAPGFINQFYEVPDYWKTYVHEVDKEREMWLNSFYKAPLRLPMPAELEYWWQNDDTPEFVVLNNGPELSPEELEKDENLEKIDPVILHTPTGRLINYTEDEEHGFRLYWQPEDDNVDPEKIEYLPLGFDEFYGRDTAPKKENFFMQALASFDNFCKPYFEKIAKWALEQKEICELKMQVIEKEIELFDAEFYLEGLLEEIDEDMKRKEREEKKKKPVTGSEETEEVTSSPPGSDKPDDGPVAEEGQEEEVEDEDEEEDDDEDNDAPSSFGSANLDQNTIKDEKKGSNPGKSPFSASSLSFATSSMISGVPSLLHQSFLKWKRSRATPPKSTERPIDLPQSTDSVCFPMLLGMQGNSIPRSRSLELRAKNRLSEKVSRFRCLSQPSKPRPNRKPKESRELAWLHLAAESELDLVLSLHSPDDYLEQLKQTM